jgi:hypothetical protein
MDHWLYDTHQHRAAGWIVLVLLVGGAAGAGVIFVRKESAESREGTEGGAKGVGS